MLKRVLIRVDDVGKDEAPVWQLLDIFTDYSIPIFCQTVPGWLTPVSISKLQTQLVKSFPEIAVNQHGFTHADNNFLCERSYEFGAARTYAQQYADLSAGQTLLQQAFSGYFLPFFTSPHDRCDVHTVQCLIRLGFSAIFGTEQLFSRLSLDYGHVQRINCLDCSVRQSAGRIIRDPRTLRPLIEEIRWPVFGLTMHAREFLSAEHMKDTASAILKLQQSGAIKLLSSQDCLTGAKRFPLK